jgi:hypothetical protein
LRLAIVAPQSLQLGLLGENGLMYEVDWSTNLPVWSFYTNVPGPTWTQTINLSPGANPRSIFFRSSTPPAP